MTQNNSWGVELIRYVGSELLEGSGYAGSLHRYLERIIEETQTTNNLMRELIQINKDIKNNNREVYI